MTAYCDIADLLVGDLQLGANDPQKWIDLAGDEIDGRIGFRYQLPINLASLAMHSKVLLKSIASRLASGRMLMSLNAGVDDNVHVYGALLVRQAYNDLDRVVNGIIELVGPAVVPQDSTDSPSVINHDATSAVDAFERFAYGGDPCVTWAPGS